MQIRLQGTDTTTMHHINQSMAEAVKQAELGDAFKLEPIQTQALNAATKEAAVEAITMTTVLLTSVGAGGAITVAFTQLARVLEKLLEQKIDITITTESGKETRISGSAGHIRKLLAEHHSDRT